MTLDEALNILEPKLLFPPEFNEAISVVKDAMNKNNGGMSFEGGRMTEQEALKYLKDANRNNQMVGILPKSDIGKCLVKALEEIQQYRAIGTVSELQDLVIGINTLADSQFSAADMAKLVNDMKSLYEYRQIGTPKECRAAVEKQRAKKPIRNDKCTCPSCGTHNEVFKKRRNTVAHDIVYCWHCGQAVAIDRLE